MRDTAIREGLEESGGFLGSRLDIEALLEGSLLEAIESKDGFYTTYLVEIPYDELLPSRFAENFDRIARADPDRVAKHDGLFEKDRLRWVPASRVFDRRLSPQFRKWYLFSGIPHRAAAASLEEMRSRNRK